MAARTLITGGPKTGKSTLASALGAATETPVRRTDALVGLMPFADAAHEVARWIDEPGPHIIEGVTVVRGLRVWLATHAAPEIPAEVLIWLDEPKIALTPKQEVMTKGIVTVWTQIEHDLERRGVVIKRRLPVDDESDEERTRRHDRLADALVLAQLTARSTT